MDILKNLEMEWEVISSSPFLFIAAVLVCTVTVWHFLEWAYRSTIRKKDATIQLLEQQLKLAKEHGGALKDAERDRIGATEVELEAYALHAGRPSVHEAFLDLTDTGVMQLRWNPFEEPVRWEASVPPSDKELERIAALRLFMDRSYISSVTDSGVVDYTVTASEKAEAVRETYNRIFEGGGQ